MIDDRTTGDSGSDDLVAGSGITKHFPIRSGLLRRTVGHVRAIDGVDLSVGRGQTVGLVGESGSGKSTLGRCLLRLIEPTAGTVHFDGTNLTQLGDKQLQVQRRHMQMVFQDPYSSMDPTATVANSVAEPLAAHRRDLSSSERDHLVADLFEQVGLRPGHRRRYPREFSGGQLQRIAIARALALEPKLIILDEPVSSLDVSIQAGVINLLEELQSSLRLTFLFIAHDLALVRHISDRICVMYLGRIVEEGPAAEVYHRPRHPYTQALLSAIPIPNPTRQRQRHRIVLSGDIPSPANPPKGCRFHTRCPAAMEICAAKDPEVTVLEEHKVFCHLHTSGPALGGESLVPQD